MCRLAAATLRGRALSTLAHRLVTFVHEINIGDGTEQ